jgi:2,3-bisphosphoglycerate-independent phosphoglycerate mutase
MGAGSDIATLSILGYDPALYYTGRGPLEAVGMHTPLDTDDIAFRCNFITEVGGRIVDYSGGHITDEEARELIDALNEEFRDAAIKFYPGVSYRNVMVLKSGDCNSLEGGAPPHDIIGAPLEESLPKEELLRDIVLTSRAILEKHEINMKRAARNERKANLVWLWSGGKKPAMPAFSELYGVSGSVVSGVYLIKGIGRCAGMAIIDVRLF